MRIPILILILFLLFPGLVRCDDLSRKKTFMKFFIEEAERQKRGEPMRDLDDLFQMYSDEDKQDILREVAESDILYILYRGRWDVLEEMNDPLVTLRYALHDNEPFDAQILRALNRTFPFLENEEDKFNAAALLYRYDKEAGKKYLLKELNKKRNPDAAFILALNKEKDALDGIKRVIKRSEPTDELVYAFGVLGSGTTSILNNKLISSPNHERTKYLEALFFGDHKIDESVIDIIDSYYNQDRSERRKILASSLMIKYHINEDEAGIYMNSNLDNWESLSDGLKIYLAKIFSVIESENIMELYVKIITDHLEKGYYLETYHIEAAKALCRTKKEENIQLVTEALRRSAERYKRDHQSNHFVLTKAIYESGAPNSIETLKEIMGEEYVEKLISLTKLKKLPKKYYPDTTRYFMTGFR